MSDVPVKKYLLFVGNPGVGKSTLLNSLIGRAKFKSGVSSGTGLTDILQWYCHNDVNYGDTPGLSDMKRRKQAGEEITKALKANGEYRLVFLCTAESGRVRPDDVTTINTVLEAINDTKFPYGIIINKMSSRLRDKYKREEETRLGIKTCFNYNHSPTDYIFTYPFNEALHDEDDKVVEPHPELLRFLDELPAKFIPPEQVKAVNVETFEEKKLKYEKEIAELQNDTKKMEIEAEKQKQRLKLITAVVCGVTNVAGAVASIALRSNMKK